MSMGKPTPRGKKLLRLEREQYHNQWGVAIMLNRIWTEDKSVYWPKGMPHPDHPHYWENDVKVTVIVKKRVPRTVMRVR